jgi:hypothetical protein
LKSARKIAEKPYVKIAPVHQSAYNKCGGKKFVTRPISPMKKIKVVVKGNLNDHVVVVALSSGQRRSNCLKINNF